MTIDGRPTFIRRLERSDQRYQECPRNRLLHLNVEDLAVGLTTLVFEDARPESWFLAASFHVDWQSEKLPSSVPARSREFTGFTD